MSACRDVDSTVAPESAAPAPQPTAARSQKPAVPADSFTTRAAYAARFGQQSLRRPSFAAASLGADSPGAVAAPSAPLLPQWEPTLGTSLDLGDDDCKEVPVGFSFTFYGREYTAVYPSSNGRVTLNYCSQAMGGSIPQDTAALVAPIAGDWLPAAGTADNVYYAVVGQEPHRRFVITWSNIPLYGSPDDARSTFQLQLLEGSNAVQMSYKAVAEVRPSLSAGISSGRGPFERTARYFELLPLEGQAICYVPNGSDAYTVTSTPCEGATVNRTPVASVGGPYAGVEGAPVAFAGSATDADGDAVQYAWNFGDGSPEVAGAEATHVYADNGSYSVTLTATDPKGAVDASTATVQVANAAPAARLAAPGWVSEGAPVSLAVADAADASGADEAAGFEYAFDCGGGYGAFGRSAAASCPTDDNGVRELRAKLRDKDGAEAEYVARVTVDNAAPQLAPLADATIYSGESYALSTRFSDAGVRDMRWTYVADWGTGTTTAGSTADQGAPIAASQRYLRPGSYTATLTVTDKDGGVAARSAHVTVLPLAVAIDLRRDVLRYAEKIEGKLAVAVLSSASLDATRLVESTVRLGRTPVARRHNGALIVARRDVNGDGRPDLVVHFDRAALVANGDLTPSTRELRLTGDMADGRQVAGSDALSVIVRR